MTARECYHCKALVEEGTPHDCWTTTEDALTRDLPEDLRDAWERVRETAVEFGEQRIYASHSSIMFSRKACYFFVRPGPKRLEICFFLGRALKSPAIRKTVASSRTKTAHIVHVRHRDEVEVPLTDWLREAYDVSDSLRARPAPPRKADRTATGPAPAAAKRATARGKTTAKVKAAATDTRRDKIKTTAASRKPR